MPTIVFTVESTFESGLENEQIKQADMQDLKRLYSGIARIVQDACEHSEIGLAPDQRVKATFEIIG